MSANETMTDTRKMELYTMLVESEKKRRKIVEEMQAKVEHYSELIKSSSMHKQIQYRQRLMEWQTELQDVINIHERSVAILRQPFFTAPAP
jgi:dTDP-4-amino-4,6-dideoxygalactose transaminase